MGLPIPEWFDPTRTRDGDGMLADGLRPSEVVHPTARILLNKLLL